MLLFEPEQRSHEWWQMKVGKVGGTRFSQIISTRKNRLVYDILNEMLSGEVVFDDYVSDDMQYGIDNEPVALELYTEFTGIKTLSTGAILSESNPIHIASPDGYSADKKIVQEVKCTMNGAIHLQRFFDGVESNYIPQCINYFAVAPEIEEVHFISYCGGREERPMHYKVLKRENYIKKIELGIKNLEILSKAVQSKFEEYTF